MPKTKKKKKFKKSKSAKKKKKIRNFKLDKSEDNIKEKEIHEKIIKNLND